ncbi:hypothetical protein LJC10_05100 [Selenomonadales bacterium OttesenSCG-928-I06]|nr:hypothetical protein [Selenomonadales bacterium OttesenSCG-928-I06]
MSLEYRKRKYAEKIIKKLIKNGYEAFLVGGAVRDIILGLIPDDFDIATSCLPSDIVKIASEENWATIETFKEFGVVTIIIDDYSYEVATFRSDEYGSDSHRPKNINIVSSIEEDLKRRDFTINALALNLSGDIIDPFNGVEDIQKNVIRTVKDPMISFNEDALRMFRAVRFAASFNFMIEEDTFKAINLNLSRTNGLSVDRIIEEFEKVLLAEACTMGLSLLLKSGLYNAVCLRKEARKSVEIEFFPELRFLIKSQKNSEGNFLDKRVVNFIFDVPRDIVLRWTILLIAIIEGYKERTADTFDYPYYIKMTDAILKRLKVQQTKVTSIKWLIKQHFEVSQEPQLDVLKWLNNTAKYFKDYKEMQLFIVGLMNVSVAKQKAGYNDLVNFKFFRAKVYEIIKDTPFFVDQLALSGGQIAEKVGQSDKVSKIQKDMLRKIQNNELINNAEVLNKYLVKYL